MSKKRYDQFCPVAYTLDRVGDRWTLMIVRDLLFGGRRFTDLKRGLPGIASNMLSDRLSELESVGFVEQVVIPPPSAVTVYELTEQGKRLEALVYSIAQFGVPYLQWPPPEGDDVTPVGIMLTMRALINRRSSANIRTSAEFHVGTDVFNARIESGRLRTQFGQDVAAAISVIVEARDLLDALVRGEAETDMAAVTFRRGDSGRFWQFMGYFGNPD